MKPAAALGALTTTVFVAASAAVTLAAPAASVASAVAWSQTRNAYDTFTRTVTVGWGTAPQGGAWDTAAPPYFRVSANLGRIAAPAAAATVVQSLHSVSAADEMARLTFVLPVLPTDTHGQYLTVRTRVRPDGSALIAQVRIVNTGAMTLSLQQRTGATTVALGSPVAVPYTATAGGKFNLDLQTTGAPASVQASAYPASLTTAPAWQDTATAAAASSAGTIAVSLYTSSAARSAVPVYAAAVTGWALTPPVPAQPGPTNTGVPAGTALTVHNGDLNITTAGTVIDGWDIRGRVNVDAPNVTIKNSIIRGPAYPTHCIVLDSKFGHGTNFLIEDTEIAPSHVAYYTDDFCGANFTALRINSHSGVDTMDIAGPNVTVQDSWLHDTTYFAVDPAHGNGPCHCDGLQITVGTNIHINHNVIRGGDNSAIQISQDQGVTTGLTVTNNWFDGGTCSLHIDDKPMTGMTGLSFTGNRFTPNSTIAHCDAVVTHTVTMTWTGNSWTTGTAANPIVYG